jgi:predicted N-acetyltransferase YhbS
MFRILRETPDDSAEVEFLYDLAFAPGRTALSSYRLRDGVDPVAALSLVARDDYDALAGAIRYWPVRIGGTGAAALLLGPVAVHPTRQGEGLGALLIAESLERAAGLGWSRAVLVGDEPYYRRFGFTREAGRALDYPPPTNPDRLLARALAPGAFDGVAGMVRRWTEDPAG